MKYIKTFEQHSSIEVTNEEIFGFGKKTYKLDEFKASKETEDFFNKRKDLVNGGTFKNSQGRVSKMEGYVNIFKRLGVPEELSANAAKALIEFAGSTVENKETPGMDKYNYTFDKDKNELIINPNGKGLFNGSPIMG